MTKFFTVLMISFSFLLSSCSVYEAKGIEYTKVVAVFDELKTSQMKLLYYFENGFELANLEKDPSNLYGFELNEAYLPYKDAVVKFYYVFEEFWDFQEHELEIKNFYLNNFKKDFDDYVVFVDDLYNQMIGDSVDQAVFDKNILILNEKSEDIFQKQLKLEEVFYSNFYSIGYFSVN